MTSAPLIKKGLLLDVTYEDTATDSCIKLFLANGSEFTWVYDPHFKPYVYVTSNDIEKDLSELKALTLGEMVGNAKPFAVEKTTLETQGKKVLKVSFAKVSHLIEARKHLSDRGYSKFEYDINFSKRYLLDKRLEPGNWLEVTTTQEEVPQNLSSNQTSNTTQSTTTPTNTQRLIAQSMKVTDGPFDTGMISFDLETWSAGRISIGGEPIVFASTTHTNRKNRILSYETADVKGVELVADEKELMEELTSELNSPGTGVIVTYNGDNFDFPYCIERAKKLKTHFSINGVKPTMKRRGLDNAAKLSGVQHIDAYQIMKLMQRTGGVNTVKLDIETVSEKVFGVAKEKVYPSEINDAWKSKDPEKVERVADYNLKDSQTALRIVTEFLPLFIELSKLTSQTLYDTTRETTSHMVEDLLLKEAHVRGMIAPNKPKESHIREREENPIKGAFVKEPLAGLHENIAVLDFASLYPSIIISHNISPETLYCGAPDAQSGPHTECKKNISPDGTYFCTQKKGLFPEILERMLKQRLALKAEYKKKKKEGIDDKILFAKQWALKIVLNSVYGYLGYPRARWYSRECASATTAWEREYIHAALADATKAGFQPIYSDTDSAFLLMLKKSKKDVEDFAEKINKALPADMELEIDGFYKRGIFVTKKEGGAAKKRYALIDDKGNLKIVGFEYVRRDWCMAARETQKKVLELVLSEGKPENAAKYVRKMLEDLKAGKVPKKDLSIMTMLKRNVKDYDSIGPHVAAVIKAQERGKEIPVGSMLSFIITRKGSIEQAGNEKNQFGKDSISQKAELEEYVAEGDYDADYYIKNQVMPAVIKIMRELGYSEEDLLHGGKQTGLGAWS